MRIPVRGALAERLAAEQEQLRKRVAAVDEEGGFEQAGTPCESVHVLGVRRTADIFSPRSGSAGIEFPGFPIPRRSTP